MRSAEPHRVEEALREDEQRGQRHRDRDRGEEHRPPRRVQGAPHGVDTGPRLRDLLAVARDDEQAVVDRQPQPQTGGQVEGEDRDRDELVGEAQQQEGADDRQPADQQRKQRRDRAAEEEQREQEEEGEGEELGHPQVLLDLLVDLLLGERDPADRDPGPALEVGRDPLRRVLLLLVVGRLQSDREVGRIAAVGEEVRALGLEVAGDRGDVRVGSQLPLELPDPLLSSRAPRRDVLDQDDHARLSVAVGLEAVARLDAFRRRVIRAVWRKVAGDAASDGAGEHEEHGGDDHHAPAAALSERCESVEHL